MNSIKTTTKLSQNSLNETLDQLEKKYGKGAIMRMGESQRVDVDAIPTGSITLDIALGVGGVPKGRVVEIFGLE
jgi:recombination protein RecA